MYAYICVPGESMCTTCMQVPAEAQKDFGSPGTRVIGDHEPSDVGAGNKTTPSVRAINSLSHHAISPSPHY